MNAIDIRYNRDIVGRQDEIYSNTNGNEQEVKKELACNGCPHDMNDDWFNNECHKGNGCVQCWQQVAEGDK
jgi:hypothetical protein